MAIAWAVVKSRVFLLFICASYFKDALIYNARSDALIINYLYIFIFYVYSCVYFVCCTVMYDLHTKYILRVFNLTDSYKYKYIYNRQLPITVILMQMTQTLELIAAKTLSKLVSIVL